MAEAFARAKAMMAMLAVAMGIANAGERQAKLAGIGAYKSRGKGRGTPSRRYGNKAGKYMPHQGAREMSRRAARQKPFTFKEAA